MRKPLASILLLLASWTPAGAQQSATPAPGGAVLFVGSNIFHRWTNLKTQMAPLPVVNRAVDGLQTTDMLWMLSSDVLPARPKVIAYYCGSNDIDAGEPAAAIVDRIRQFVDRVAAACRTRASSCLDQSRQKAGALEHRRRGNQRVQVCSSRNGCSSS